MMASPYPLRLLFQIMMGEEIEMADNELELEYWTVPPSHRHRGKKVDVEDLYGSPCVSWWQAQVAFGTTFIIKMHIN